MVRKSIRFHASKHIRRLDLDDTILLTLFSIFALVVLLTLLLALPIFIAVVVYIVVTTVIILCVVYSPQSKALLPF